MFNSTQECFQLFNPIQARGTFRDPPKVFVHKSQSFRDNFSKFGDFS